MSTVLRLALIVLVATLLALVARVVFINSQATPMAAEPDVRVRVAAADLPAGLLLREADLDWQHHPRSQLPKGAITEGGSNLQSTGALLRRPVKAGQVILTDNLIRSDAPGFLAAALQPGKRAVTIPVNDVSGNAGLLQPGDYVDIILTQRLPSSQLRGKTSVASETIVEAARIIAVGSRFKRDEDEKKASRVQTVTIEADARTAEAVSVASEIGSLSLALRSFALADRDTDDSQQEALGARVVAWEEAVGMHRTGPVWGQDISRVFQSTVNLPVADTTPAVEGEETPRPAHPAALQSRTITVIRGEKSEQLQLQVSPP